jgi:hypothetical protein
MPDVGVSHHTVDEVRTELVAGGQIAHLKKIKTKGKDGKSRTRPEPKPPD